MNKIVRFLTAFVFLAAAGILNTPLTHAQTTWSTTPTSGQLTNSNNWVGSVAPPDNTSWLFTNSSIYTLTNGFSNYTVTGITFANYTLGTGTAYTISGSNFTLTGGITNSSTTNQTISAGLTINSAVTLSNTANSSAAYITLSGALSGSGTITYGAANSGGRLVLQSATSSNFTGALIANSGRVNISSGQASSQADYTFNNSGGTFLTTSNTVYNFGSLSGSGTIQANGGTLPNTLVIGAKGNSTTFSGNISSNFNGTNSLIKVGIGTLTLSGANSYLGTTTISNGVLRIGAGGTTGSFSNTTSITIAGGSLAFDRSDNISQGVNFLANGSAITGAGGLIKLGAGTLSLNAANTYNGDTVVSAGALRLSNSLAIQSSALSLTNTGGAVQFDSSLTSFTLGGLKGDGNLTLTNLAGSALALTLSNAASTASSYTGALAGNSAGLTLAGTGTQTLSGNNTYSGGTTLNAGTLGVGHASALGSGALTIGSTSTLQAAADGLNIANNAALNSGTLTVDVQGFVFTNSGAISGTGALAKAGSGTLVLAGNNTYSGGTTLSNGVLAVNSASSLGDVSGALTFAGASTLRADASFTTARNYALNAATTIDTAGNNLTNTGVLSGAGVLTKAGTGTLTLSGVNTYSAATVISGGTLTIGGAGQLNSGSYATAITNSGIFNFASSANQTLSGAISGSGNLTKAGNGTLTLTGNNSYTGKTSVSGGTLAVGGADNRLGTAPASFVADQLTLDGGTLGVIGNLTFSAFRGTTLGAGGGTFNVSNSVTLAINTGSVISGAGSLTKTGDGTLSITAANTYSGGTTIGAGTTRVGINSIANVSGALGVGDITLQHGVKLTTTGAAGISLYAPKVNLLGDITLNEATGSGSALLAISAVWDLGGASRTITVQRTNSSFAAGLQFSSAYTNPVISNGSLTLASDATATAASPSVVSFNTTSFTTNTALTLGDGVVIVSANGSFFNSGSNAPTLTLQTDAGRGGGVLQLGFGASGGVAVVRNAEVFSLSGGGLVTASNATNGTTNTGALTINNGGGADFSGTITDGGAAGFIRLVKSGTGTQILSGSNSYSGTTTISTSGGLLQFAKTAALYAGDSGSWDKTKITVNSGGTIGFNVGGTGEFSSADVTSILTGLGGSVNNNGLRGGSAIAFDTANAAGGNFSITDVLANSTGTGAGSLGITKLGANTLTLSGANTFTGALTVRAGTLDLASTGGAAAGSAGSVAIASGATLLISQSDQVNGSAAVTLSGGTISRATGVSEVFGNLNITAASFLDFGSGTSGTLQFQNYANTGSALVTVQNFFPGNKLQFTSSSFGTNSLTSFSFGSADYTTGIEGSYFTITAIPEPSTVVTSLGLLAMLGWPATRRWLRNS